MADYVEDEEESSVEKIDDNVSESLENSLETTQDDFKENTEDTPNFTEQLLKNEEEFCEEKFNSANDDGDASLNHRDDEKIAELETSILNDSDVVNSDTKEQEPEVKIAETNNVIVVEKDLETTPKVEDVGEIFSDTARLVNDVPPENSEFRHRHLREKVENTEEYSPSRSTVRFEPVENKEEDNVFQELKQDASHVQSIQESFKVSDTSAKSKSK